jgi:LemA protein
LSYPDLKASASYLELQRRISALEEQIAHRREYYNEAVNLNNVRMEQFAGRLFAEPAGPAAAPAVRRGERGARRDECRRAPS